MVSWGGGLSRVWDEVSEKRGNGLIMGGGEYGYVEYGE